MWVEITKNIEIPDVGSFAAGEQKDLPEDVAAQLIERGAAKSIPAPGDLNITETDTIDFEEDD